MQFADLKAKEKTIQFLQNLVAGDRLPHAILFTGPEGNGKTEIAIALANYILCSDRKEDSCGVCKNCLKSKKLIHPDLKFVFPVVKKDGKKREDTVSADYLTQWREFIQHNPYGVLQDWMDFLDSQTQSNINRKECVDIIKTMGLHSFESEYKLLFIWHAESLGKEGNRLLKLIEEPPENTLIILVAQKPDAVLGTILSRCQIINVPPFDDVGVDMYLEKFQLTTEQKTEIVHLAEGNMNAAIQLAENTKHSVSAEILDWFRIAYQNDPSKLVQWVNAMASNGKPAQKTFLSYGLFFMREYLKLLYTSDFSAARLSNSEKSTAEKMTKIIDAYKAEQISETMESNLRLLERNANSKILFMDASIDLGRIMKMQAEVITN